MQPLPQEANNINERIVITADDVNADQKRKWVLLITSDKFWYKLASDTPLNPIGFAVMSAVCLHELITTRKNGNKTYIAITIAIIIFITILEVFSLTFIIIPPPSY
jgi:hypothetical protein